MISNHKNWNYVLFYSNQWEEHNIISLVFLPKWTTIILTDQSKLRDIIQNNWPVILKFQDDESQGENDKLFQVEGD